MMHKLLLMFLFINFVTTEPLAVIVHSPQSKCAIEGDDVSYYCSVIASEIDFIANGTFASDNSLISQGFLQSDVKVENGNRRNRSLVLTAKKRFNNTKIFCQALTSPFYDISEPATLQVQGPLSPVFDLSYSFIDSSTINISWSPPFTLPGTDITGYNISATSNGTTTNYFTSESYYELTLTEQDLLCEDAINVSVSGYNGLDGSSTVLQVHTSSSKLRVINESVLCNEEQVIIVIVFDVSQYCNLADLPTHAELTLESLNIYSRLSIKNTTSPSQPFPSTMKAVFTMFKFCKNEAYSTNLSFYNLNGSRTIDIFRNHSLSTFNCSLSTTVIAKNEDGTNSSIAIQGQLLTNEVIIIIVVCLVIIAIQVLVILCILLGIAKIAKAEKKSHRCHL